MFFCQGDPYLRLVDDSKLQAVETGSGSGKVTYGSKEDDDSALMCLSQIEIKNEQSTASLVSIIIESLDNLSNVSSTFDVLTMESRVYCVHNGT